MTTILESNKNSEQFYYYDQHNIVPLNTTIKVFRIEDALRKVQQRIFYSRLGVFFRKLYLTLGWNYVQILKIKLTTCKHKNKRRKKNHMRLVL